ncbi:MAG TPA: alpha/beta hydrolase [Burkholderiaceae bacterium]|nr:alpha/beta hydrolase [Burkholderiaceae bacterium]
MLHPQTQSLLELYERNQLPPVYTLTPPEARRSYRERRALTQPDPSPVSRLQELRASGPLGPIGLRLYRPLSAQAADGELLPALVYFHGGGWVIGDLDTHDTLCRELANGAGCAVVSVDYRLAPEHRFPAAVHDCVAAIRWVRRNAAALQLDADRIAVGGDSAGGNLAAVVSITLREEGDPPPVYQMLIYPSTDMRCGTASHTSFASGYLLTRESIAYYHGHYVEDAAEYLDWRASPLLHPDLSELPPALVLTAGFDPLRDEGLQYAQRLSESGNRATSVCFERQIHGFITMGRLIDEANTAVNLCAAELRRALAPTESPSKDQSARRVAV